MEPSSQRSTPCTPEGMSYDAYNYQKAAFPNHQHINLGALVLDKRVHVSVYRWSYHKLPCAQFEIKSPNECAKI
jgi:hypothetical protein